MNTQNTIEPSSGLIVTANFVEAEDIADALRRFALSDILHARDSRAALGMIGKGNITPAIALIALDANDTSLDVLVQRLAEVGTQLVLINGDPKLAVTFGTTFLQRPFSDKDLDQCIEELIPGA